MTDNSKRTGPALKAHYQFLLWLINRHWWQRPIKQATEKFPRSHKFTIGDRVHNTALDIASVFAADAHGRRWHIASIRGNATVRSLSERSGH